MPQIVCSIALDVSVNNGGQMLTAKQGDSRTRMLCVQFTDCGKPLPLEQDATVLLNVARDGQAYSFEGSVNGQGEAVFVIPAFALEQPGPVHCDVSAVTVAEGRLTTSGFIISVEAAVCPGSAPGFEGATDIAAEFLAQQQLHPLIPQADASGYVLHPLLNRRYTLDLSQEQYKTESGWKRIFLQLPAPAVPERENWVLIYCHAPLHEQGKAVNLDFSSNCLFADGMLPGISMANFDIICTYSALCGRWQIGIVQYSTAQEAI